jgi:uncharacterized protein YjiS (DUF1127 family)
MVMKAQAHPGFSSSGAAVAGIGSFFRRALRNWNDRRTVTALSDLDDHLLADIGLTRSDLDWALAQFRPAERGAHAACARAAGAPQPQGDLSG